MFQLVSPHQPASSLLDVAALLVSEQPGHGGDLTHLDGVAVEAGQDTVQAGHVAADHQVPPAADIPLVRLAGHAAVEAVEVALDRRLPLLEALVTEEGREPPVQLPRAALRTRQLGDDGTSYDLELEAPSALIPHAVPHFDLIGAVLP